MNKQGSLDIQTAIFEGYLEIWLCSTKIIQKLDYWKLKLMQNLVNFHILAKSFFFESKWFLEKRLPKPAIVQLNDGDQTKPSGFVFLIRIPWFEKKKIKQNKQENIRIPCRPFSPLYAEIR